MLHGRYQSLVPSYEASEIAGGLSDFSPAEDISTYPIRQHLPDTIILC